MSTTDGDGSDERTATRTAEASAAEFATPSSTGAAGLLVPFQIDPGSSVLQIGAESGALTQALAQRGAQVEVIEENAEAAGRAAQSSADLKLARVEQSTLAAWLKSRRARTADYDLILYRQGRGPSADSTASLELVVQAASELLKPAGTLVVAVGNPWGLRAMLGSDAGNSGRGRAGLRVLLDGHGFTRQRWLLPYPDFRAPEVIVDTEFLEQPVGASLAEMLVRRPLAAPNIGGLFVTDPLIAFRTAIQAGLAADIADTFLIAATRSGQVDDVTRSGQMWLVPPADMGAAWQRPRELLEIGDRWLMHPLGSYEGMSSGPLRLASVTRVAMVGKSGEDVLTEALIGPGPFAAVTQGLLRAWWNGAQSVIAQSEPGQHPLDLRPRHFAVNERGDWLYVTQDLSFRFQVPAEVLALAAMVRTIFEAVLPRGWMRGLEPSMTVAQAARFLLDTIDVSCGPEHVMLWLTLETDISVRISASGLDHVEARRLTLEIADTTLGATLDRLPLAARLEAGMAAMRLAAESESRRSEIAELRSARDAAAEGKMRAELESERLRGVVSRLRAELESSRASRDKDDGTAALEAIGSFEDYQRARNQAQPWISAAALICAREGLETEGRLELIPADSRYAVVLAPPDHVIKFYGPWEEGHGVQAMETEALRLTQRDPSLPLTRLVAEGALSERWRYVILTRIRGVRLVDVRATIDEEALVEAAAWMGRFARQIHAVPLEASERDAGWARFRKQTERLRRGAAVTLAARQALPRHLVDQVDAWLPPVSELSSTPERAVLTHGDLTLKHILGDVQGGGFQPAGVIDLNDSFIGAAMYDLGKLWWSFRGDPRLMGSFLAEADLGRPGEPGFQRLALAWLLMRPSMNPPELPWIKSVTTLDELAVKVFGSAHE